MNAENIHNGDFVTGQKYTSEFEKDVRQKIIHRLVRNYGYSPNQMTQDVLMSNSQRGQGAACADVVVWRSESEVNIFV